MGVALVSMKTCPDHCTKMAPVPLFDPSAILHGWGPRQDPQVVPWDYLWVLDNAGLQFTSSMWEHHSVGISLHALYPCTPGNSQQHNASLSSSHVIRERCSMASKLQVAGRCTSKCTSDPCLISLWLPSSFPFWRPFWRPIPSLRSTERACRQHELIYRCTPCLGRAFCLN